MSTAKMTLFYGYRPLDDEPPGDLTITNKDTGEFLFIPEAKALPVHSVAPENAQGSRTYLFVSTHPIAKTA